MSSTCRAGRWLGQGDKGDFAPSGSACRYSLKGKNIYIDYDVSAT
jgi:hypothetical protein